MTFTTMHNDAGNGRTVNTVVELQMPSDNEKFAGRPWFTQTRVNYTPVYHSFHFTRGGAERAASRMHASYLKAHSGKRK